ncbi:MAG: hypothetical protein QW727_02365 [Candidatus Pacearchaeota archaeon]
MEVILDSGFILYVMRKKIDFISQLKEKGFKIRIPREVIQELKDRRNKSFASREERLMIDEAIKILEREGIKRIDIGKQKIADWFVHKGKDGYYIATTNSYIKHRVPKIIEIIESHGKVEPIEINHDKKYNKKLKKPIEKKKEFSRKFSDGGISVKGYVGKGLVSKRLRFGEPQFHKKQIKR